MTAPWTTLVRIVLRTFPSAFRERFGDEMEEHFHEVMAQRPGPGRTRAGGVALGRLGVQGLAERVAPTLAADRHREPRRWGVEGWARDVRLAVRSLTRRPGWAAVAIVTVALGIGANAAIFSLIHGVLLTPLDFPDADGLIHAGEASDRPGLVNSVSAPEVYAMEELPSLESVAGVRGGRMTLTGFGPAEAVVGARVTRGLLEIFRLEPTLGRDLRPEEGRDESVRRIVVSHGFWMDRLGGDPEVLGRTLTLDGESWEVIGVAPEDWAYPSTASFWIPGGTLEGDCYWGCNLFRAVGRLADGATLDGVRSEALALSLRLEADHPDQQTTRRLEIRSLHEQVVGQARRGLWVLLGAVGVVLLIACANVANLLLVRAQNRRGEVAVRRALGASRRRLVREVLTESAVLAGLGGLLGLAMAAGVLHVLPALAGGSVPRLDEVSLDGPVLAFTMGTVGVTVILAGLLPALRVARSTRRMEGRGWSPGRREARSRNLLLSTEVGLSLVLLVGAGLLLRTFAALSSLDPGFTTENVVRFDVSLPDAVYDEADEVLGFVERLEGELAALPGVESAATGMGTPLTSYSVGASLTLMDREPPPDGEEPDAAMRIVTPAYLELQGIELLRGRGFSGAERNGEPSAYLVNEAFVRRYLRAGEEAVGIPMRSGVNFGFGRQPGEIVGVVEDIRAGELGQEPVPEFYAAFSQYLPTFFTVNVRTVPGAEVGEAAIRSALASVDPDVPLFRLSTVEEAIQAELAPSRFYLALVGAFAGLALVLSAIGLYGVVAYAVARRTREIGVRVALGADGETIRRLVLTEGLKPTLLGLAAGVAVAVVGSRAMQSLLYGVEPLDPATFVAVPLVLLVVAVAAILAPARRATRVDPVEALRGE